MLVDTCMTATLAPDVDTAASDELAAIRATIDAGLARHAKERAADERQRADIESGLAELQALATMPDTEDTDAEPVPVDAAA